LSVRKSADSSARCFHSGRRIARASHLPSYPFNKTDQDALNIAVMTAPEPVSIMGSEGMDFRPGGWTMSHALGMEKPWRQKFIRAAFGGRPPSFADREFWQYAGGAVPVHSAGTVRCAPAHPGNRQCHRTFLSPVLRIFGRSHEPPLRLR
jgi:hypothetical protein